MLVSVASRGARACAEEEGASAVAVADELIFGELPHIMADVTSKASEDRPGLPHGTILGVTADGVQVGALRCVRLQYKLLQKAFVMGTSLL